MSIGKTFASIATFGRCGFANSSMALFVEKSLKNLKVQTNLFEGL